MTQYRTFRNGDPPQILQIWNACELGRGAARTRSTDAFELFVYSQPYFDPAGLILAVEDGRPIGFVHAGFGFSDDRSRLQFDRGVICVVLVDPQYRRRGIGTELVRRAEEYLRERGTAQCLAGGAAGCDPFYFGIYGGARPSGFLQSDPLAHEFFRSLGYAAHQTHTVFQRQMQDSRDPVNLRIIANRRQTELIVADQPGSPTWWWHCHFGRWGSVGIDSLRFRLVNKATQMPLAAVTVVGLDSYVETWHTRAIGLVDLFVAEEQRGRGYGQSLIVEIIRRLRRELIDVAEMHVADANVPAARVAESAGFSVVDRGTVYRQA